MKLADILDFIQPISFLGNKDSEIFHAKSIDDSSFGQDAIGWCSDKNFKLIHSNLSGTVIVSENYVAENEGKNPLINLIVVQNPRRTFSALLAQFFTAKVNFGHVSESAFLSEDSVFDPQEIWIGSNVVIEANCTIGKQVYIDHNTVIKAGTIIEDKVKIGSNCTIGGVGFGYEPNEDGVYELIPHIGNVRIKQHVEIGNNVCIDRAVMGSTTLEEHVKVDNLVHIAHGVQIGKNSLVIANAMIAGSVQIGENSWIAPSSSIIQKVKVGSNVLVGLGSVVLKDVENGAIVAGVPAKKINKN